jgi:hypothetical protein
MDGLTRGKIKGLTVHMAGNAVPLLVVNGHAISVNGHGQ